MPRLVRPDAVLVQAVIAGALSFAHLHDLAEAAGQQGWKAWAYPVSVDLLLVAAWHRLRSLRDAGEPAGSAWSWFVVALAASLGANVATAGLLDLGDVPDWLRILVAGWPALAFLGGTLLVHRPTSPTGPETEPDPEPPSTVERATEPGVQANPLLPCLPRRPPRRLPLRPRSSPTPRRSRPTIAPAPARPLTPRPCAPGSASRSRWPKPSPPSSSEELRCPHGSTSARS